MSENLYHDTDAIKQYVISDTAFTKQILNRIYGKGVENMRNDFIVLHIDGAPLILRKDVIIGVKKAYDGKAGIATLSTSYFCMLMKPMKK